MLNAYFPESIKVCIYRRYRWKINTDIIKSVHGVIQFGTSCKQSPWSMQQPCDKLSMLTLSDGENMTSLETGFNSIYLFIYLTSPLLCMDGRATTTVSHQLGTPASGLPGFCRKLVKVRFSDA